jgi:hypothetical protein
VDDPEQAVQGCPEPIRVGCKSHCARRRQGKNSACILICDITRPVPNGLLLPSDHKRAHGWGTQWPKINITGAGGHRSAPAQRGRGAEGAGGLQTGSWITVRKWRTTLPATMKTMWSWARTKKRHRGQAGQALRPGRSAHRHRPGGAPLHGRATPGGARLSPPGWRTRTPSAASTPPCSWETPRR